MSTSLMSVPHMPPTLVWDELADEAQRYISLLESIKRLPVSALERSELEDRLMDSLSHLQMHSQVLEASVVDALEAVTE